MSSASLASRAPATCGLGLYGLGVRVYGQGQNVRGQDVQIRLQTMNNFVVDPKLGGLATEHPGSVHDAPLHHASRARSRRP